MTASIITLHLALGLVVGLVIGLAHAHASRRAAAAALEHRSAARLLLGFPVRVAVPGAALFGLALVSPWALAGAMPALLLGQRLALARFDVRSASS